MGTIFSSVIVTVGGLGTDAAFAMLVGATAVVARFGCSTSITGSPTIVSAGTLVRWIGISQSSGIAPSLAQGMHFRTSVNSETSGGTWAEYTGFMAKMFCGYKPV